MAGMYHALCPSIYDEFLLAVRSLWEARADLVCDTQVSMCRPDGGRLPQVSCSSRLNVFTISGQE